ncbi:MAG TPA: PHP domain-containing protein, partial [Verrucomicrobiae bacterium]|nr:PHP domain-containing protein [Verrucomicrobiae bacterium]
RRASRSALMWAEEAAAVQESGRSLTELRSVGPFTAHFIARWLREPPDPPAPPPLRAGFITYAHARAVVDGQPEWRAVARADHQMHTNETDGSSTIEEMVEAAAAIGRERIAITDHSKTLRITNGMDEARLLTQGEHITAVNASRSDLAVLRGIEMDLTPEGAGDMDPSALAELDLVLGAFHSKLRLRDDQTERYFRALENPDIQVLAHPRGRIYNFRAGLSCDWERVARHAVETGTALEIDAYPDRQDLDVERLRIVAAEGAWVSIGTDAHTPGELVFLEIGIAAAILAGIPRERVLNLLSAGELARQVGLVRATKKRHTAERSTTWQGASASASTPRQARRADPATSAGQMEANSAPDRPARAEASLKTSESKPRTRRRKV